MLGVHPLTPSYEPAAGPSTRWRIRRGRRQVNLLRRALGALAVAHGGVDYGDDDHVEDICRRLGLGDEAVAIRRCAFGTRVVTVLSPTERTWSRPYLRRLVEAARVAVGDCGRTAEIRPSDQVLRQPRLTNTFQILSKMRPPAAGDAERLELLLEVHGAPIPLERCSGALPGIQAAERIFGLVAGGKFEILHDRPLGPESRISLRSSSGFPDPVPA